MAWVTASLVLLHTRRRSPTVGASSKRAGGHRQGRYSCGALKTTSTDRPAHPNAIIDPCKPSPPFNSPVLLTSTAAQFLPPGPLWLACLLLLSSGARRLGCGKRKARSQPVLPPTSSDGSPVGGSSDHGRREFVISWCSVGLGRVEHTIDRSIAGRAGSHTQSSTTGGRRVRPLVAVCVCGARPASPRCGRPYHTSHPRCGQTPGPFALASVGMGTPLGTRRRFPHGRTRSHAPNLRQGQVEVTKGGEERQTLACVAGPFFVALLLLRVLGWWWIEIESSNCGRRSAGRPFASCGWAGSLWTLLCALIMAVADERERVVAYGLGAPKSPFTRANKALKSKKID